MTKKLMKFKRKITDHNHRNKYITTQEFAKLKSQNFENVRVAQENLASNYISVLEKKDIF